MVTNRLIDMTGRTFGRLRVKRRATNGPRGKSRWHCLCACGHRTVVSGTNLRSGHSLSCGCLSLERMRGNNYNRRHGGAGTSLHNVWTGMNRRCSRPNNKSYKDYGARGIRVHPPWQDSFALFREWVLANIGDRPSASYSLDRVDNDGHYEPGNLRWATRSEQRRNRRRLASAYIQATSCSFDSSP
jgi:hypothetical protein